MFVFVLDTLTTKNGIIIKKKIQQKFNKIFHRKEVFKFYIEIKFMYFMEQLIRLRMTVIKISVNLFFLIKMDSYIHTLVSVVMPRLCITKLEKVKRKESSL